jgi:hypothetical protein
MVRISIDLNGIIERCIGAMHQQPLTPAKPFSLSHPVYVSIASPRELLKASCFRSYGFTNSVPLRLGNKYSFCGYSPERTSCTLETTRSGTHFWRE